MNHHFGGSFPSPIESIDYKFLLEFLTDSITNGKINKRLLIYYLTNM